MNKKINTELAPAAIGSYSQAILAGNSLFCSGQIGLTSDNKLISDDVEKQVIQILNNIQAIVEAAGFTINDIVKTSIFMTNISDFKKIDQHYSEFFKNVIFMPARSAVCVTALPGNAKVEIEAVAIK
jgi:2-iminobutanoate/2-iminopropanoate deaminase